MKIIVAHDRETTRGGQAVTFRKLKVPVFILQQFRKFKTEFEHCKNACLEQVDNLVADLECSIYQYYQKIPIATSQSGVGSESVFGPVTDVCYNEVGSASKNMPRISVNNSVPNAATTPLYWKHVHCWIQKMASQTLGDTSDGADDLCRIDCATVRFHFCKAVVKNKLLFPLTTGDHSAGPVFDVCATRGTCFDDFEYRFGSSA